MKKHQRQELEESIQRDAARYRWLKERHTGGSEIGVWRETKEGMALKGGWLCGIELDEAVDYAMTLTPNDLGNRRPATTDFQEGDKA